jgi:hypothetical protein
MKFEEVLPALREGKRVKRSSIRGWIKLGVSDNCNFELQYFLTDDWEIEPEPKSPKLLACFVYINNDGEIWESRLLRTEEDAKKMCEHKGYKLIKWPHGEVIEVPG